MSKINKYLVFLISVIHLYSCGLSRNIYKDDLVRIFDLNGTITVNAVAQWKCKCDIKTIAIDGKLFDLESREISREYLQDGSILLIEMRCYDNDRYMAIDTYCVRHYKVAVDKKNDRIIFIPIKLYDIGVIEEESSSKVRFVQD